MAGLLRHRQTKGAATDRLGLRDAESYFLLYPIWPFFVVTRPLGAVLDDGRPNVS